MSSMINPTLRVYLTDFIGTDKEDEVIEKITEYGNEVNNMKLYFWFDQTRDKVDVAGFVKKWDRIPHNNFKTIVRPHYFDMFRDFIWYDIIPRDESNGLQYSRFRYVYSNPATGILEGLQNFQDTILFVNRDTTPKRKQKRNDYEDSNNR